MMEEYEERDLASEDEYDAAVKGMNRVLGKRKALLSRSGMAGLGRLGLQPPKQTEYPKNGCAKCWVNCWIVWLVFLTTTNIVGKDVGLNIG